MIEIELLKRNDCFCGFCAKGHAMYSDYGSDIVCSAVSALTQTALLGIVEVVSAKAEYSVDDDGFIDCMLSEKDIKKQKDASLILSVMYLGLCNIESNYSGCLKVSVKEL